MYTFHIIHQTQMLIKQLLAVLKYCVIYSILVAYSHNISSIMMTINIVWVIINCLFTYLINNDNLSVFTMFSMILYQLGASTTSNQSSNNYTKVHVFVMVRMLCKFYFIHVANIFIDIKHKYYIKQLKYLHNITFLSIIACIYILNGYLVPVFSHCAIIFVIASCIISTMITVNYRLMKEYFGTSSVCTSYRAFAMSGPSTIAYLIVHYSAETMGSVSYFHLFGALII